MIFFMKDIYYKNTLYFCIFRHVSCLHFFSVTMSNEEEKEEEDVGADAGLSEPGLPGVQVVPGVPGVTGVSGVPWHPQILAHQLFLSQPEGSNYDHHITKGQLILECLLGVINFPKSQRKIWQISALETKKWSNQQSKGNCLWYYDYMGYLMYQRHYRAGCVLSFHTH